MRSCVAVSCAMRVVRVRLGSGVRHISHRPRVCRLLLEGLSVCGHARPAAFLCLPSLQGWAGQRVRTVVAATHSDVEVRVRPRASAGLHMPNRSTASARAARRCNILYLVLTFLR